MKIYRIALTDGEGRDLKDNVRDLKRDLRDIKKDNRDIESRVKKIEKIIDELNLGNRRFWQMSSIFTSVQRKLERFDVLEQEWKKYKAEGMTDKIKREVEQKFRAQIK